MLALALGVLFHLAARTDKGRLPSHLDFGRKVGPEPPKEPEPEVCAGVAAGSAMAREREKSSPVTSVLPRHIPGLDGLRAIAALSAGRPFESCEPGCRQPAGDRSQAESAEAGHEEKRCAREIVEPLINAEGGEPKKRLRTQDRQ
jgi:hypothetical protein